MSSAKLARRTFIAPYNSCCEIPLYKGGIVILEKVLKYEDKRRVRSESEWSRDIPSFTNWSHNAMVPLGAVSLTWYNVAMYSIMSFSELPPLQNCSKRSSSSCSLFSCCVIMHQAYPSES
ncbi:hypothetical protein M514_03789 [Trichuris suis]|uniref:Uncharacterized protein n=1 Tax=Trichuris suis TaxID=68888 RepID=A0A085ME03_9BILA|nr:hypothetical protein M513_03789 [Trichuris suis]KFD62679.1 hypothetical protein M514_03789 [Trichuris suis]